MTVIQIQLFGGFYLNHDGKPVTSLDSPRLQSFLGYLLLHAHQPQPRHYIASVLWQESTESQARTNLRKYIHQLRNKFPAVDELFDFSGSLIQWRSDAAAVADVHEFERCLELAHTSRKSDQTGDVLKALERAVEVYQGDLLPACYEEWVAIPRSRFASQYIQALDQLAHLLEQQGQFDRAIYHVQQLLAQDSLHESSYRRLIQLYDLAGNRAKAIETYHQCALVLRQEMGIAPSSATQSLYEQLKNTSPTPTTSPQRSSQITRKTVLYADIVGFVRMSEQYDSQTIFTDFNTFMNLTARLVQKGQGQVVKRMGDAIIAMFDKPIEALQTAYLILNELQTFNETQEQNGRPRFPTRIGIATGEVLLAHLEIGGVQEIEILGSCINTALQLERVTPVNGITLDQLTYSHCKSLLPETVSETRFTSKSGSEPVYILEN